ncbi:polysaccharide deacetylase family protein [Salinibacter ruber]|uniref:polysaccharide deacetylase family protein n=1 Tax=Salinibacter ruber TaxID=146919 RepID=UPI0021674A87|nr:polysaccharide deacetylase family protein [Salinibacter ruber]MCS4198108.1 peptidoglycan/xylan/chitin deacetylase (PgdA/CDA1 family) [Salinibacter ruber]
MYHYVRDETTRPPDYYYLDVEDFRQQLDYFRAEFGFVTKADFRNALLGNTAAEGFPSGVLLTFDDGFRDHYDFVFPELKRRGLWGIFYVPTGPYMRDEMLDVHRTHALLGEVPGVVLLDHVLDVVDEAQIPHARRDEYREQTYERQDDTEATKHVKRILNYFISDQHQSAVLDELIARIGGGGLLDPEALYMTPAELREMHESGMVIGGHTVTHPVLSKLNKTKQRNQVVGSLKYLDSVVGGLSELTFCYPYGHSHTFDAHTVSILDDVGCEWSFKVEATDITEHDCDERPQALPRYDCTQFPHGAASGSIGPSC